MIQTIIINGIVFVLFPLLVLWKCKYNKTEYNKEVLTVQDSQGLRGVAAIFIMFAHYLMNVEAESDIGLGPAKLIEWFGGLGVCLFFFLSGYGMYCSAEAKGVKKTFLIRRFVSVLPTYFIMRIVFGFILHEYENGFTDSLSYLFGIRTPLWFIDEIIIIYILFFIAAKMSMKGLIPIVSAMLLILSVVFLICGFDPRWYNANLIFAVGMVFAKYREAWIKWLSKGYILKLMGTILLFLAFAGVFVVTKAHLYSAVFKLIAGAFFCMIFVTLLMKFTIQAVPIIYIGKKSLEFYMTHIYVWLLMSAYVQAIPTLTKFMISIVVTILLVFLYGTIYDIIRKNQVRKDNSKAN